MNNVINLNSKKRKVSAEAKYHSARIKQQKQEDGVSYSDVVYTEFHDQLVGKINFLLSIQKDTPEEIEKCRKNIIVVLSDVLSKFLVAVHTKKTEKPTYELDTIKRFLDSRYEKAVVDYLAEENNPFFLEDV